MFRRLRPDAFFRPDIKTNSNQHGQSFGDLLRGRIAKLDPDIFTEIRDELRHHLSACNQEPPASKERETKIDAASKTCKPPVADIMVHSAPAAMSLNSLT